MAKPAKTERQKVIDEIRRKEKGADKRRGFLIVGVCVAVAVLIVGAAVFRPVKDWWDMRAYNGKALSDIGAPASVLREDQHRAGRRQPGPRARRPASPTTTRRRRSAPTGTRERARDHVAQGVDRRPPRARGAGAQPRARLHDRLVRRDHRRRRRRDDRARGRRQEVPGTTNFRYKFYAAPWTSDDGRRTASSPTASTSRSRTGRPVAPARPTREAGGRLAVLLGVQRRGPRRPS